MAEQNIGAARVHLVVDATDWDASLAQARGGAELFGRQAEQAFERSSAGVRRAASRIADYVASLKSADAPMERQLRQLARLGADDSIVKALATAWSQVSKEVQQTSAAMEEAQRINVAFDQHRASLAQFNINQQFGIGRSAMDHGATISALQQMVVLEGQLEAEAHNINSEYQRWQAQIDAIGKDFYEIQIMQARQRYGSAADPIVRQIEQFRTLNTNIRGSTVNTKQLQQAIRFLPAQFTDIGVSAAAGMNPLLIVLQQGGQILDQFRLAGLGVKDTLLTVGQYALRLVNPFTVGAAAVGGLAFAAYDTAKAMEQLAVATAKGYQVAGSPENLFALAESISEIEKVNTGSAEDAVARLAAGGRLAGDNLRMAAEATARWAAISGEAVDDVAGKFEAIAKGPLEAIESGQVRVTEQQYDYIKSLVESGDQQAAVNELTRIFYDTVNNNSDMVEAHLSYMSRTWKEMKDGIGAATREVGGFADFLIGASRKVMEQGFSFTNLTGIGYFTNFYKAMRDLDAPGAGAAPSSPNGTLYDPNEAKRTKQRADELARWNATADQAAQRQLQLNKLREEGRRLGQDEATINAVLLRQQKEWAEQDSRRNRGGSSGDRTKAIRDAAAAEIAAITTQTRLVQSEYEQRQISVGDYYAKLRQFADEELAVTMRSIEQQKVVVSSRKDAAERLDQLESQAAAARERYSQRSIDLKDGEAKAVFQLEVAYRQFTRGLADSNAELQRQMDGQLARLTMGAKEYERLQATNEVYRKQDELLRDIGRQVQDRTITAEQGEQRIAQAVANTATQLAILQSGYAKVDAAEGDFFTGSERAWKDWQESVGNISQQGYQITTNALTGAADAITDALTGNLDSFKNFFDNLHREILSFIVKQQLTAWLKSISAGGGEGGNWFSSFASALFAPNAQGGVYADSGLSAYRNSIVSQPTVFPFARGGVPNIGLMGERSGKPHEAIFPVTRMPSGDLGVKVVESGKRGPVTINQPIYIQGRVDDRTTDQVAAKAGREAARAMNRSGN